MKRLIRLTKRFRVVGVERGELSYYVASPFDQETRRITLEGLDYRTKDRIELDVSPTQYDLFAFDTVVQVSFTHEPLTSPDTPPSGSLVDEPDVSSELSPR